MENNKCLSSNLRTDLDHGSIESADSKQDQNNDPPPDDEGARTLSTVISRLQTVRLPGWGRVDAEETIAVAMAQGKAYERWCNEGKPVGEIEVWVEGNRVMSAHPEPPAQLQEFKFSVPSPDTSVLQVTTQTNKERTVLYNLLLRDVPPNGLFHEEKWPNGQSMSVHITREAVATAAAAAPSSSKSERFCISVAINCNEASGKRQTNGHGRHLSVNRSYNGKAPANNSTFKVRAAGAAWIVTLLLVCLALPIVLIGKTNSIDEKLQKERADLLKSNVSYTANTELLEAANDETLDETLDSDRMELSGGFQSMTQTNTKKLDHKETGAQRYVTAPAWAVTVVPKLAGLKNMYVRMDTKAEPARLKSFFVQALAASESFNVLAESDRSKADGVITLRFEHSAPCVGVVFAKVTGPDGKFLWEGYKWEAPRVCVTIPNSQDKMFDDASTALVDRLEKTVRYAQWTSVARDSSVDGG